MPQEKNKHIDQLIAFGLTRVEASLYVHLLTYGKELGGTKLALVSEIHRQNVYLALPKLISLGLVEEVGDGKHKKYRARPPIEIEKIGRKRALEAGDLAHELHSISNIGNEQDFEVLQGKRAIQEYELQYASRAEENSEEYIIGGASTLFSEVMEDTLLEYLDAKTKRGIKVAYLGTEDERSDYTQYVGKYPNQEYRFLSKLPKGNTHMIIRNDTVSFYSFLKPPLVYIVKSPVIAKNYKDFFQMLWEMASP